MLMSVSGSIECGRSKKDDNRSQSSISQSFSSLNATQILERVRVGSVETVIVLDRRSFYHKIIYTVQASFVYVGDTPECTMSCIANHCSPGM